MLARRFFSSPSRTPAASQPVTASEKSYSARKVPKVCFSFE